MSGSAPKYTVNQNMQDRMVLLGTGVAMQAKLGDFGPYLPGATAQIRLRNVGVITGLKVRLTASVTITTAVAVASPFGPYGIVSKFSLLDYNTTERIFASGPMIYMLSSIRRGCPWMGTGQGLVDTLQTALPVAVGAAQTIECNYEIPVAYDAGNDLRGAILAQTVVGEMFLRITFNLNQTGDPSAPYLTSVNSSVLTISNIMISVWQNYIQPQSNQLPLYDLNTVYEYAAMFSSSDNIVVGGTKYLDYPNVRSVMGSYLFYVNNSGVTVNETDISALTLIANGNTRMREMDPLDVRKDMRLMLGGDLAASMYYIPTRRQPIQTWIYSQVQLALQFAAATGTSYVAYGYESTYALNTPLPGIAAGS